ncbi:hypothetical protein D9757_008536 [Collybiopsis confluens]|uniref:Cytochrome c oxidase subunit n=1 Tax=Collybiopsis confluens TaxID=2823264 RepID=A0A8H5H2H2_9AGAR|nr:hypothetical protein D9757_008536 [Collybiopsis confluens]
MSDSETIDLASKFVLKTVPFDGNPFSESEPDQKLNYTDYFKCIAAKGEDFPPCKQFFRAYQSLCPNEWKSKWDEQRENGTFPASLEP